MCMPFGLRISNSESALTQGILSMQNNSIGKWDAIGVSSPDSSLFFFNKWVIRRLGGGYDPSQVMPLPSALTASNQLNCLLQLNYLPSSHLDMLNILE